MSRIRSRRSEFAEEKLVSCDAEVINDIGHDATRHVTRMPGEGDEAVGLKRIGAVPMAAWSAQQVTAEFPEPAFELPTVVAGVFAHGSGSEDKLVAEGGRNGAAGFEEGFEVGLGRLLEAQGSFAPVASVRMTTGQEAGFGNPDTIFILSKLHFRKRNDHNATIVARHRSSVKGPSRA